MLGVIKSHFNFHGFIHNVSITWSYEINSCLLKIILKTFFKYAYQIKLVKKFDTLLSKRSRLVLKEN